MQDKYCQTLMQRNIIIIAIIMIVTIVIMDVTWLSSLSWCREMRRRMEFWRGFPPFTHGSKLRRWSGRMMMITIMMMMNKVDNFSWLSLINQADKARKEERWHVLRWCESSPPQLFLCDHILKTDDVIIHIYFSVLHTNVARMINCFLLRTMTTM